jgi:hypothetical protein
VSDGAGCGQCCRLVGRTGDQKCVGGRRALKELRPSVNVAH